MWLRQPADLFSLVASKFESTLLELILEIIQLLRSLVVVTPSLLGVDEATTTGGWFCGWVTRTWGISAPRIESNESLVRWSVCLVEEMGTTISFSDLNHFLSPVCPSALLVVTHQGIQVSSNMMILI